MNKKIVEDYMNEVWNKKNLEIVKEIFSDTAVIHSPLGQFKSPQEMSDTVSKWITAIPDIQVDLLNTLEDNGIVVSHWKAEGTHQKDFNGIKAKLLVLRSLSQMGTLTVFFLIMIGWGAGSAWH